MRRGSSELEMGVASSEAELVELDEKEDTEAERCRLC